MRSRDDLRLVRLLQLASPTLPVGAYSYSQGLEAAVEAGAVRDSESTRRWVEDVLRFSLTRAEAPLFLRMVSAWRENHAVSASQWNEIFLATRETAELRAETVQMGYSLRRLLGELGQFELEALALLNANEEPSFPLAFSFAIDQWDIDPLEALTAYLWSWIENQVMAAIKAVPLGQTDGQRLLLALGDLLPGVAAEAASMDDDDIGSFVPGLALASTRHEMQYSRIFRS